MNTHIDHSRLRETGACRSTIGIWGDRSCPELHTLDHCHNCPVYTQLGRQVLDQAPLDIDIPVGSVSANGTTYAAHSRQHSLFVFRLGGDWLALPTAKIREVVAPLSPHPIPHRRHKAFEGLVNIRGEVHPCVSLTTLLNCESGNDASSITRLVLLEDDAGCFAFLADEVHNVVLVLQHAIAPPPVSILNSQPCYITGIAKIDGHDVGLIDDTLLNHSLKAICQ